MSLNSMGIGFLFTAQDAASGVMDRVGKSLKGLEEHSGKSFGNIDKMVGKMGTGLTLGAIGVGGLGASFALGDKAGEFEQALAAVGAVSNASAEDMQALKDAAINAGKATQYSPTQAVQGLNELAQAGFDAQESIGLLQPTLALAAGSLGDLSPQEAAGLASQALKAFGIDASLAGKAVDQMLQASNAFAVRAADLPLGLGNASRGAQLLNQSLTETIISFGLVKNTVPGTEKAATAVSSAMERLAKPEVQQALKAQGIAVTDAQGNYRQFLDVIKDLMPALDKMTQGQAGAFLEKTFGSDALTSINSLMGQFTTGIKGADGVMRKGGDAIDYLRQQFRMADGVAQGFADKMLDTYEGQKTLMAGSMETLMIMLGEPFKNMWRPIIESVTSGLNGLIDIMSSLSPGVKDVFAGLVMATFALLLLGGGILLAGPAWALLKLAFIEGTIAAWGLVTAVGALLLEFWPIIAVGLAIAAVIYAVKNNIFGLGDAWDTVVEYFTGGWEAIKEGFDAAWNALSPTFESLQKAWDRLSGAFSKIGEIFEPVRRGFSKIMEAFGLFGSSMDSTSSGPGKSFIDFFTSLGEAVATVIGWIVSFITNVVDGVGIIVEKFAWMKPIVGAVFEWIGKGLEKIAELIKKVAGFFGFGGPHEEEIGRSTTRGMAPAELTAGQQLAESERKAAAAPPSDAAAKSLMPGMPDLKNMPSAAALQSQLAHHAQAGAPPAVIDYDKLTKSMMAAMAAQKVEINVDGEKIAAAVQRGARASQARMSGADMAER